MDNLICSVEEGQLKGQSETDIEGTPFISFMGVPYAKAPIGKLRFKSPQPPDKWEGVRDATKEGEPCYAVQFIIGEDFKMQLMGSEDCLVLNIYTRKLLKNEQTELKPVMVFIHGGAFVSGSPKRSFTGPEFLMTQDIVLVTIQYRVGALGFLAMDDPSLEVTGNAGLKDQVQALKWIQKNIKQFSGDPNNVTIFGHSAGAASVHYLVLSPLAQGHITYCYHQTFKKNLGLFHKAILQSGTSLCPWARGISNAKKLAEILGCKESQNEKVLEFLQEVPVEKLLEAQNSYRLQGLDPSTKPQFGPTVEPKSEGAFLCEEPLDIINSGKYNHVPLLFGYTSHEGMIEAHSLEKDFGVGFENYVPYYFGCEKNSTEFEELNKKIIMFYFGTERPNVDNKELFYNISTDTVFLNGIYLAVKAHAKTCQKPIYFYRMSLETDRNVFKKMMKIENKGVCHGDEVGYLFQQHYGFQPGSIEEQWVFRFVKMWTNFAKTGNPIPTQDSTLNCEWKPVTENEMNFLNIGTELVSGIDPDIERMKFWDEITKEIKFVY